MTNDERVLFAGMRAFDAMYGKVEARLRDAAIRMLRDAAEVAEFMQDCKAFVLVNAATFDPERGGFEDWAERMVVNECRKRRKVLDRELPLDDIEDRADQRDQIAEVEARVDCEIAIAKLPKMQRICCQLKKKGYNNAEIAKMLDIGQGAVRVNLFRARESVTNSVTN